MKILIVEAVKVEIQHILNVLLRMVELYVRIPITNN